MTKKRKARSRNPMAGALRHGHFKPKRVPNKKKKVLEKGFGDENAKE